MGRLERASRHVGETLTFSGETEQTAPVLCCRLIAGRLHNATPVPPPPPATCELRWPACTRAAFDPRREQSCPLGFIKKHPPMGKHKGTVAVQPTWATALIAQVIGRSAVGGRSCCLRNEQRRTRSLLAAFKLKKRFLWGFSSETS